MKKPSDRLSGTNTGKQGAAGERKDVSDRSREVDNERKGDLLLGRQKGFTQEDNKKTRRQKERTKTRLGKRAIRTRRNRPAGPGGGENAKKGKTKGTSGEYGRPGFPRALTSLAEEISPHRQAYRARNEKKDIRSSKPRVFPNKRRLLIRPRNSHGNEVTGRGPLRLATQAPDRKLSTG